MISGKLTVKLLPLCDVDGMGLSGRIVGPEVKLSAVQRYPRLEAPRSGEADAHGKIDAPGSAFVVPSVLSHRRLAKVGGAVV
jgi:hypothetical protein